MNMSAILVSSLWAGFFSTGLGVLLTAPRGYLVATFVCGCVGRGVRDLCIGLGMGPNWATVLAAAVVVLGAVSITHRQRVSPVVLICSVLPLGAAVAMFNLSFALMRLSSAAEGTLDDLSVAVTSNLARAFTTSLAIALGLAGGMTIVRLFRREETADV